MKSSPCRRRNLPKVASVFCALVLFFLLSAQFFVWVTKAAMEKSPRLSDYQVAVILGISRFPRNILRAIDELRQANFPVPDRLLISAGNDLDWAKSVGFPSAEDPGYLLFSGVDPAFQAVVVKLIKIGDGSVKAVWNPPWKDIVSRSSPEMARSGVGTRSAQPTHPMLLDDGALVFSTGYSLVKMSACGNRLEWVVPEEIHHSVDMDSSGNFWVPVVDLSGGGYAWSSWARSNLRDDAIGRVDGAGKLDLKLSIAGILIRNGLVSELFRSQGERINLDPVHLNQIAVAKSDSKYWRAGDLLISARHLSAVFIYRPSTDRVVRYRSGPWVNQHSAAFYGGSSISIFNNNAISGVPEAEAFLPPSGINEVMVWNLEDDSISQPFSHLMARVAPRSITNGRAQILRDGGLFVEETDRGRHLRFLADRLLWIRANRYDSSNLGYVSWSRYLSESEVVPALAHLGSEHCRGRVQ